VTGADATTSGLLLLPLLLGAAASTAISGRLIVRTGHYKAFPIAGLAVMALGLLLLSELDATSTRTTACVFVGIFGLGFGLVSQVLVLAIQNAVEPRDIGITTASANLFRALGGSLGVAVFGAIFSSRLSHALPRDVPAGAHVDSARLQASPAAIRALPHGVQLGVEHAVASSLHVVFLVAAPFAALGLIAVLFLRELPLRDARPAAGRSPVPTTADEAR
jgi:MFS family permease